MLKNPQSSLPQSGDGLRTLAHAIVAGALLIFAGLAIVAVSVLGQSPEGGLMASVLSDRSLHYVLMAAIVVVYVYLQRR